MDFEDKALAGLNRLPKLDPSVWDKQGLSRESGDQRRAPFKGAQNASAAQFGHRLLEALAVKYGSYDNALSDAPIKRVGIASLRGVQPGVRADIVADKIHEIANSDEIEAPSIVRYRSKLYLLDGYHTLTALKLGGVRAVEAKVMSL